MRIEKKNYPHPSLFRRMKIQTKENTVIKFVDTELESGSEPGLGSDTELKSKLESVSEFD